MTEDQKVQPNKFEVVDLNPSAAMVYPFHKHDDVALRTLKRAHVTDLSTGPIGSQHSLRRDMFTKTLLLTALRGPAFWESPWTLPRCTYIEESANKARPSPLILSLISRLTSNENYEH